MPEGDTIHRTAAALRTALVGRSMLRFDAPRLVGPVPAVGRVIEAVESRGKHLEIIWDDGLVLHTHMRMTGSWHLYRPGERWQRPARQVRALIEVDGWTAVCFNAPIVETYRQHARHRHPGLGRLGPDLCRADADLVEAARRLFEHHDQQRTVAEALLDQHIACGVGNVYRSEVLWACAQYPFAPIASLSEDDCRQLIIEAASQLRANLHHAARHTVGTARGEAGHGVGDGVGHGAGSWAKTSARDGAGFGVSSGPGLEVGAGAGAGTGHELGSWVGSDAEGGGAGSGSGGAGGGDTTGYSASHGGDHSGDHSGGDPVRSGAGDADGGAAPDTSRATDTSTSPDTSTAPDMNTGRGAIGLDRDWLGRPIAPGLAVYGRNGQSCLRCGDSIEVCRVGEQARLLYWCPGCQVAHAPRPTADDADHAGDDRDEMDPHPAAAAYLRDLPWRRNDTPPGLRRPLAG